MSFDAVEKIADAILYEGYLLYPYRRSALKNQRRWDFGLVYPPGREHDNEPSFLQAECLVVAGESYEIQVRVRFLHSFLREHGADRWQDATERTVAVPPAPLQQLAARPLEVVFQCGGDTAGQQSICGKLELSAERLNVRLFRFILRVRNIKTVDCYNAAERLLHSFASTHAIVGIANGSFISLLDPPDEYKGAAEACRNAGLWPVLAGERTSASTMLFSPIILYDYPEIAHESAGDLFDGTEIDEMLTLRILTLSEPEKQEIKVGDPRGRALLERTETLGEDELRRLHGAIRKPREVGEA